ncbi:MAG: hypothetical protein LBN39_10895, partial [Planctomycetaceae bacterium]|nr:hypothetical protein [Planctomycetaceae bacterium]
MFQVFCFFEKNMFRIKFFVIFMFASTFLGTNRTFSEDGSVADGSVVKAKYTTSQIILDGKVNEDCWKLAKPVRIEKIIKT